MWGGGLLGIIWGWNSCARDPAKTKSSNLHQPISSAPDSGRFGRAIPSPGTLDTFLAPSISSDFLGGHGARRRRANTCLFKYHVRRTCMSLAHLKLWLAQKTTRLLYLFVHVSKMSQRFVPCNAWPTSTVAFLLVSFPANPVVVVMVKSLKIDRKELARHTKKTKKDMPFTEESTPVPKSLRCMRDRQRSWVMAGLQHIKAPVVFWHLPNHGTGLLCIMRETPKTVGR